MDVFNGVRSVLMECPNDEDSSRRDLKLPEAHYRLGGVEVNTASYDSWSLLEDLLDICQHRQTEADYLYSCFDKLRCYK